MRSLFVVAMPRSFSSETYGIARRALGLAEPTWTTDGEILNRDRMTWPAARRLGPVTKFSLDSTDPALHPRFDAYLRDVTEPEGYAYKDVLQPFFLTSWEGLRGFRVLRIHRDLVDVTFAMLRMGWFFPYAAVAPEEPALFTARYYLARAFRYLDPLVDHPRPDGVFERRLEEWAVAGIVRAHRTLEGLEGEVVDYEALVEDEGVLQGALERLYPEVEVPRIRYIDDGFERRREGVRAARRTRRYGEVRELVERVREELGP